jgi:hypothetical protein
LVFMWHCPHCLMAPKHLGEPGWGSSLQPGPKLSPRQAEDDRNTGSKMSILKMERMIWYLH